MEKVKRGGQRKETTKVGEFEDRNGSTKDGSLKVQDEIGNGEGRTVIIDSVCRMVQYGIWKLVEKSRCRMVTNV